VAEHIYQNFYNEATRQDLVPEFIPLDNTENARPDWAEYWPIRNFLKTQPLIEDDWYGFFSPKFLVKTGLTTEQCLNFIDKEKSHELDVIVFSPYWDVSAFFNNAIKHGNYIHPGLLDTTRRFFELTGSSIDVNQLLTHSQNTAFCNYFIAKPRFWRRWLECNEALFTMAEDTSSELYSALNGLANYLNHVQKVFIMERMATTLLASEPWQVRCYDSFSLKCLEPFLEQFKHDLILCDALKVAYTDTGHTVFYDTYIRQRNLLTQKFPKDMRKHFRY